APQPPASRPPGRTLSSPCRLLSVMERHECRRDATGTAVTTAVRRQVGAYHDSMRLMAASRTLSGSPGGTWGGAVMGTPPNLEVLAKQGVDAAPAHANDLILAVRADSADHAEVAL